MTSAPIKFRRPMPRMTTDPARQNRNTAPLVPREVAIGTVGYCDNRTALPEGTPAWIRWEQGELLVEVTLSEEDRISARLGIEAEIIEGQQVVMVFPGGEPNAAIIIGVMHSTLEPAPGSVCGVSTGAANAIDKGQRIPGATWSWLRFEDGHMLAIQTNDQDVSIWAGAGVHIKATAGAIHLDGTTHLGSKPLLDPIGSSAAPGGEEIPGVPAVPFVPVPYAPPGAQPNIPTPYVGNDDGIVRAKDLFQSNTTIDPAFWAWMSVADPILRAINPALPPLPVNLYSAISGAAGPGSRHTADDPPQGP